MAELWEEWGALAYLAVAVWAFFEGETFVLAAAALGAMTGVIDPWLLMVAAWGGSFAGDQTWFTLGRRFGPRLLRRMPRCEAAFGRAAAMLQRHGTVFIVSFRFLYGIRNVAAAVCGMAGIDRRRFVVLNFIGAGVWAGSFVAAGWYLGAWLGPQKVGWGLAAVVVAILVVVAARLWRRPRVAMAAAE